ncbi:polynucleotide adenylyltransferase PcnB [Breznakiellaceae bacterium SP9]
MRIRYATLKNGKLVKKAIVYTQDEHGIEAEDVDKDAVFITDRLKAAGYETYIVGGAVRDLILKKKPKDFDIVSSASPSKIKKLFRSARVIGKRFRLVHVYFGVKIFEVSTFRSLKDGSTSNTFGTIEEDVNRRDFTLNALFYDPAKQIVVDYVDGMRDIRERRIRPIIPLDTIFIDDPVRMIRAVKYAAAADFKLPLLLRWKIRKQSNLLSEISPSRLTEEILKIINAADTALIAESLESFGLYTYLQPNASKLIKENPLFKERYFATLRTLKQPQLEAAPTNPPQQSLRDCPLAALIRDFLEDSIDWAAGGTVENYKTAFLGARKFVFPMNPPRIELDKAVRFTFEEHGISLKKIRYTERGRPLFRNLDAAERAIGGNEGEGSISVEKPAKKRRTRRRKPGTKAAPEE